MSRVNSGIVKIIKNSKDPTNRLLTTGVIRSRSGPDGFVYIGSEDLLDLYFSDAINYASYKKLFDSGVDLLLSRQSSNSPEYSLRINNNSNIPISYHISSESIPSSQTPGISTQEGLGQMIFEDNYTLAYKLYLSSKMTKGQYLVIPTLSIDSQALIICGTPNTTQIPLSIEQFRDIYWVSDSLTLSNQITRIKSYLDDDLGYTIVSSGTDYINFYSLNPKIYKSYYELTGYLIKDEDYNHKLLVDGTIDSAVIEFTSKIKGSKYINTSINIESISYSQDYLLTVSLDNYTESYLVEFKGGTNHYIEDVLLDSHLISAKMLKDDLPEGFEFEGEYKFRRNQPDLDISNLSLIEDAWQDLEQWDVLQYILIDDGFRNSEYSTFLLDLARFYNAFLMDSSGITIEDPLILSYPQILTGINDTDIISYTPVLEAIYSQNFLEPEDRYLISGDFDETYQNGYKVEDYGIFNLNIISTSGEDQIKNLIIKSYTKRLDKLLEYVLGSDNYYPLIENAVRSALAYCPMIEYAKIIEVIRLNLHTLRLKLQLQIKKYSTGIIIINFNIKL